MLFGSFCLYSLSWIEECGTINLSSLPSGQLLIWVDGLEFYCLEFYCFLLKLKGIVTMTLGFQAINEPSGDKLQLALNIFLGFHTHNKIRLLQRQGNIVDRSE